jgi:hypothetical protein
VVEGDSVNVVKETDTGVWTSSEESVERAERHPRLVVRKGR